MKKLGSLKDLVLVECPPQDLTDGIRARIEACKDLISAIKRGNPKEIASYAIGDISVDVNYSAQEKRQNGFRLSNEIKQNPSWENKVYKLTLDLKDTKKGDLLKTLTNHSIDYLKVSVASEIAMVLDPSKHCLINKRTIFGMYYIKYKKANNTDPLLNALKDSSDIIKAFGDLSCSDLIKSIKDLYSAWAPMANEVSGVLEDYYNSTLKAHYNDDAHKFFVADRFCSQMFENAKKLDKKHKKNEEI